MNSHEVFIHIHQGCFAGTGAIVRLPQCQWSKPDGYGKISQCITTTKHSKAKTVCIFLGIYCTHRDEPQILCIFLWTYLIPNDKLKTSNTGYIYKLHGNALIYNSICLCEAHRALIFKIYSQTKLQMFLIYSIFIARENIIIQIRYKIQHLQIHFQISKNAWVT